MKSKILFLYRDPYEKRMIELCQGALKTVFRKFRKSVECSLLQLDLSPSFFNSMKDLLKKRVSENDCIIFIGKPEDSFKEDCFFQKCFALYSRQYFSSGKCICSPLDTVTIAKDDSFLTQTIVTDITSISETARLAVSAALSRKKTLLLCTDTQSERDAFVFNAFSDALSIARKIRVEHTALDEIMYAMALSLPGFDTVLTTDAIAHILVMNINSLNKFPASYSIYHCKNLRIYKKEALPYDTLSNLSYASLLVSCSAAIESELGFKGLCAHLKKSAVLTLEKCADSDIDDFQKLLISQLNVPLRNRQVKHNENNN